EMLHAFFDQLSPTSRWRRFFSMSVPSAKLIGDLCDSSNPHVKLTLIVTRTREGADHIIATGSYIRLKDTMAEVAFAVNDEGQGKRLGTVLLERLALVAVRHGFTKFQAVTHADNQAMLEVFRGSGFQIKEKLSDGAVDVNFLVLPNETSVTRSEMRDRVFTTA